ncbi:MAG: InlB B-repeat-containing protein [Kiritimatiellae bacterium]|nr:InlB B-repeat-containing protein [Kiritimatiellia bacterium]
MENGSAKKCLGWLAACALAVGTASSAWADTETVDGVQWTYYTPYGDNTVAVVDGAEPATGNLVVPSELGGCRVTGIGSGAFRDCTSLEGIAIPAGVTNVETTAFTGCTSLSSYTVDSGNAVYSSTDGVLFDAAGTTLVAYPAGRTDTVYTIPAGVVDIRGGAFAECRALAALEVEAGNKRYLSVDGGVYSKDGTELVCWPRSKASGNVVIPSGTRRICAEAFRGMEDMVSVSLPEGLKRIERGAFMETGLETVTVPKSVRWIGGVAFYHCPLRSATVLGGAISGQDGAFARCTSLKTLTLGTRVSGISSYAFFPGYPPLETVHAPVGWEGKTSPISGRFGVAFTIVYDNEVDDGEPTEEEEEYEDVWNFQVVDGEAVLGMYNAVGGEVVIPSMLGGYPVKAIADYAFYYDGDVITSMRIPASVERVGQSALSQCSRLASLHVPSTWEGTSILDNAGVPAGCTVYYYDAPPTSQRVVFDANGGTCRKASVTAVVGGTYTKLATATWENHVFQGWYDAPEGGNRVRIGMKVTEEAERTLYAHWKRQTVHFDANGGTCRKESVVCYVGGTYSGFPACTWENHVFQGWYDAPDGGTRVKNGMQVTAAAERTLYAHWKRQTVHFDPNGGTSKKKSVTCYVGGTYTTLASASWDGRKFLGWYDARTGGSRVKIGMEVTADAARTLYAHWEQTVRFDGNGGKSKKASMKCVIGETYTSLATATRDGYTFAGWYDAPEGGSRVKIGMTVSTDRERTLYAHWKAKAAGKGLAITGFAAGGTPRAEGARTAAGAGSVLAFEAEAGSVYELQWTPAPGGEWTAVRRWTAEADGETAVEVPVRPGEASGFYRLAMPSASAE